MTTAVCLVRGLGSVHTPRNVRTYQPNRHRIANYHNAKTRNPVPNRMPANRNDQAQPVRRTVCGVRRTNAYEPTAPKLLRRVIRKVARRLSFAQPVQHNQSDRIDANLVLSVVYRVEY